MSRTSQQAQILRRRSSSNALEATLTKLKKEQIFDEFKIIAHAISEIITDAIDDNLLLQKRTAWSRIKAIKNKDQQPKEKQTDDIIQLNILTAITKKLNDLNISELLISKGHAPVSNALSKHLHDSFIVGLSKGKVCVAKICEESENKDSESAKALYSGAIPNIVSLRSIYNKNLQIINRDKDTIFESVIQQSSLYLGQISYCSPDKLLESKEESKGESPQSQANSTADRAGKFLGPYIKSIDRKINSDQAEPLSKAMMDIIFSVGLPTIFLPNLAEEIFKIEKIRQLIINVFENDNGLLALTNYVNAITKNPVSPEEWEKYHMLNKIDKDNREVILEFIDRKLYHPIHTKNILIENVTEILKTPKNLVSVPIRVEELIGDDFATRVRSGNERLSVESNRQERIRIIIEELTDLDTISPRARSGNGFYNLSNRDYKGTKDRDIAGRY